MDTEKEIVNWETMANFKALSPEYLSNKFWKIYNMPQNRIGPLRIGLSLDQSL